MKRQEQIDVYGATVDRMEPNIAFVDASAYYASAAISLKRIADSLEHIAELASVVGLADLMEGVIKEANTRGLSEKLDKP